MKTVSSSPRYVANIIANMAARYQSHSANGQAKFLRSVATLVQADAIRLELSELERRGGGRE